MLDVSTIDQYYGGSHTLRGVSLSVRQGECLALLGRNGVGKTTLLKCVMGVLPVTRGGITFDGADITRLAPHQRAARGMAYVPQGRDIFARLTVEENILMGMATKPAARARRIKEEVFELFPVLKSMLSRRGGDLSGGQQQQLAIARALMSRPRLLLLDEPSLGLAPLVVKQIFGAIRQLNAETGLTVLLVEQNANQALRLAHRGYVMVTGRITMSGSGRELLARPEIRDAYLGGA